MKEGKTKSNKKASKKAKAPAQKPEIVRAYDAPPSRLMCGMPSGMWRNG